MTYERMYKQLVLALINSKEHFDEKFENEGDAKWKIVSTTLQRVVDIAFMMETEKQILDKIEDLGEDC